MPRCLPFWIVVLFLAVPALPLNAQGQSPQDAVYCPASPEERTRQCRRTEAVIGRNQDLLATVGRQMQDAGILLVRVERAPEESVSLYRERVRHQRGVATAETNRWLPVLGRYYDPERQVVYVAMDRQDYWRYLWEKLAPDENLARRTFISREKESRRYKASRYTGPGAQLARWEREIETARRFQQACCSPEAETTRLFPSASEQPARP